VEAHTTKAAAARSFQFRKTSLETIAPRERAATEGRLGKAKSGMLAFRSNRFGARDDCGLDAGIPEKWQRKAPRLQFRKRFCQGGSRGGKRGYGENQRELIFCEAARTQRHAWGSANFRTAAKR